MYSNNFWWLITNSYFAIALIIHNWLHPIPYFILKHPKCPVGGNYASLASHFFADDLVFLPISTLVSNQGLHAPSLPDSLPAAATTVSSQNLGFWGGSPTRQSLAMTGAGIVVLWQPWLSHSCLAGHVEVCNQLTNLWTILRFLDCEYSLNQISALIRVLLGFIGSWLLSLVIMLKLQFFGSLHI